MTNTGTAPEPSWHRSFWSLIATQFQGAFSDNVLKTLVTMLVVGMNAPLEQRHLAAEQVGALFSLPFILFSLVGGYFADRFSKRTVAVTLKVVEVGIMLFAVAAFAFDVLAMQLTAVFLMGTHSAIFGPSKYGLLPEMLPEKRLSWGNGVLLMGTNVAILGGTLVGSMMAQFFRGRQTISGLILAALAVVGFLTSLGINRLPVANPGRKFRLNPFADFGQQWRVIRKDRVLRLAVLGNCYFWFLGALWLLNLLFYGTDVLDLREQETLIGLMMAAVGVGIGIGSVAAGLLSGRKIEYGLIPLGSIGLTVFGVLMSQPGATWVGGHANSCLKWAIAAVHQPVTVDPAYTSALVNLALLGFFGGFYVVPISALLQHRPDKQEKGGVLAAANLLSSAGVFLASGAHYAATRWLELSPPEIFLTASLLTLAGTIYAVWLMPDSLLRLLLWMLTHTIYRIRVEGRDNIPERGGALFVCNHVSFVDALLLIASTDRFLRCIMFKDIYEHPVVRPFAKIMHAIPVSSQQRPRELIQSLREASEAVKNGEVVCIFAEGQITRIGQLLPFRRGFERIMKDVDAPIIPVCVEGVWGSIFSFDKGRFLWKVPRSIPYPVTVCFGKPMPPTSTPVEVRQAVQDLISGSWPQRRKRMRTLPRSFVRTARTHPFRFAMADANVPKLSLGGALTQTVFLARRLRPVWKGQEMVGILLPPSVAGALVNHAALLMGKVPVNLNYTANEETLASCAKQCNLATVLTSKAFLDKAKVAVPGETVLLEDLAAKPGLGEKIVAVLMAWLLPTGLLERVLREAAQAPSHSGTQALDSLATIIFSSGSTGDPKGVMLTHYNIGSNIEQLGQMFAFHRGDCLLGILPFFHSFGFTVTLALPPVLGIGVIYHPTPLDAAGIGELCRKYKVTFLMATPTFLQLYLRGCEPENFGSLQYVVTGAEKLPERLAQAFEDKFGIRPLEGYGCTECSPAVTVNARDFRAAGFRQVGFKRGKIGHPLPAVTVRIVDPETMQPVPIGQPGLMLVRGPNVMKGYLGKPEKTAEVLRDGWYVTGDVAALDEDGFLQITDRLTRFSKIGGEMVPHIKIEDKLHELAGVTEQTFAVTGVPDEKKGERLVVLHTLAEEALKPVTDKLAGSDLPNLWKPRPDQFFLVDKLPYLGTGKLDLRKVREKALELAGG